ncbi:MAG TPA: phosphate acyltransferase [Longimicrobiaceae bacterium]|nr:phosphate acyltransferase [Longimicrobiaceae bacterium]
MGNRRQDALDYHSSGRRGKIAVVPTKPASTQRELSLAYSPGVAEPCREIAANPEDVFRYTARGNLVAVVSNGTAVLGLGDIGPLAAKPDLNAANTSYKLMMRLGGAEAFGPILLGMGHPVHVLQRGSEAAEIANLTAVAVVDAQER